eukprot:7586131-Lingulodinium_polyedra.AAC.1
MSCSSEGHSAAGAWGACVGRSRWAASPCGPGRCSDASSVAGPAVPPRRRLRLPEEGSPDRRTP